MPLELREKRAVITAADGVLAMSGQAGILQELHSFEACQARRLG
jgi:hypothetical protein